MKVTKLWNYLISWGPNFVDCGCFAYSLGCNFSRKTIYLIISFRRGCKFVVKGTHEYHENWDSANSNDPRVIFWKSYFILVLSAFNGYKSFDRSRKSLHFVIFKSIYIYIKHKTSFHNVTCNNTCINNRYLNKSYDIWY